MNEPELVAEWENDGFKLVKSKTVKKDGNEWVLYNVNSPYSTTNYGRHFGMLMVIDGNSGEILAHDMENESHFIDDTPKPLASATEAWFDSHVRAGFGRNVNVS
jgi:hypothetical protein